MVETFSAYAYMYGWVSYNLSQMYLMQFSLILFMHDLTTAKYIIGSRISINWILNIIQVASFISVINLIHYAIEDTCMQHLFVCLCNCCYVA